MYKKQGQFVIKFLSQNPYHYVEAIKAIASALYSIFSHQTFSFHPARKNGKN
jgi:hypothetical protein